MLKSLPSSATSVSNASSTPKIACNFGAPGADQSREPEHFTLRDVESKPVIRISNVRKLSDFKTAAIAFAARHCPQHL